MCVSQDGALETHLEVNYDLFVKPAHCPEYFSFKNEVMFQPRAGEQGTHFR